MFPHQTLTRGVLPGAALLLATLGCAAPSSQTVVAATFGTDAGGPAITYLPDLVPVGSTATVEATTIGDTSTVTFEVSGLLPNRTYGAHAHRNACGPTGADAGSHFQHIADPVTPSVDPAYANPHNEVWLDVTTDGNGTASVTATQAGWAFTDQAAPQSIVVHEKGTATEPGRAGTAGDRAACVTVAL